MFRRVAFHNPTWPSLTRNYLRPITTMSLSPHADALLQKASRKAVAVALNYAAHAAEMRSTATRDSPYWFFKPSTSYLFERHGPIELPPGAVVHHEVELGVVMGKPAKNVPAADAISYIAGYVCAIDITARNWQKSAKEKGRPWSLAKGCDTFCPMSRMVPPDAVPIDPDTGLADVRLHLEVNGECRQTGSTKDMVWTIPELVEHVSKFVTLEEWDVILTGTPEGVGQIHAGDIVTAGIEGLVEMRFEVIARQ